MNYFNYKRRPTIDITIGNLPMGSNHPVVIQTMTDTDTLDTEGSVAQCERIIEGGADLIRLTTQGIREAKNLGVIRQVLRDKGHTIPLSADIHFNPRAADVAATVCEKVRINPGNFLDRQTSKSVDYTDEEYQQELDRIRDRFVPFLQLLTENNTALRIGVNHGSLSERIMNRYGDTPEGMVESCMEYLQIAVDEGFTNIVISMKSSNTLVMTKSVRMLIARMEAADMHFPLHLGVTEAGDGEDGRIKSAVGIGALLSDGIGDTIRVSLSENPEEELPVARKMMEYVKQRQNHPEIKAESYADYDPYGTDRRNTYAVRNIGGDHLPIVISDRSNSDDNTILPHFIPDYIYVGAQLPDNFRKGMKAIIDYNEQWEDQIDQFPLFTADNYTATQGCDAPVKFLRISYPEMNEALLDHLRNDNKIVLILTTDHINGVGEQRAAMHQLLRAGIDIPVIFQRSYNVENPEDLQVKAGVDFGTLYLDGFGNGIMLTNNGNMPITDIDSYAFGILQASRIRTSKTEFISCPGCGRTLFDLKTTVDEIKKHFSHLRHLKIGIMGCIVNGPGEMADADYGYVGTTPGKISLYKKKEVIERNIPQEQAVEALKELIKSYGDWVEPDEDEETAEA